VVVVVVIIPIAFRVPAMSIFVPPAVAVLPTVGARFRQFVAPVFGLRTLPSMFVDGFMELMVGLDDALLTLVGPDCGPTCEQKGRRESHAGQRKTYPSHFHPPIDFFAQLLATPDRVEA
jgi:hypothetical protein